MDNETRQALLQRIDGARAGFVPGRPIEPHLREILILALDVMEALLIATHDASDALDS